ncbi:Cupin 2 conserved barrel domain protein [Alkalidesulfovibrio alkalitolerans DSM 16529]|jgi:quercetin dioxygenase-like cupin family protein|uniref:Cupin 2 conserved barrel domain protein n=1 Tax=Alkalidesulfovibrio alkalitolerans DSM 16529 TaxID=1121439 RepID=S7UE51_9BACT|nr:cupin domain-containing protein [Alkalidesulfovibrio alkalitolerans]EPR30513.1 Cupin 2 conserved barrel domain protein [Alkalidesulfovibrio alkalitolerans DSM 16529]
MKTINLFEQGVFKDKGFGKLLVHDSPYFRILNFNFEPGQELPVHNHDVEGQLSILVVEGEGEFLGADNAAIPAKTGDVLIADIAEPHGIRATTRMRVVVTIAPTL